MPKLLYGQAAYIIAAALNDYCHLMRKREEAIRKTGRPEVQAPDPPYKEIDIKRAWKRMQIG